MKLSGAEKKMEVPPIVSEEDFQKVQERINDSVKLPAPKRRSTPNILIKKIYDRASGERLLCRTTEDETRQIYSFDRKYKCFSGKAPYIESTEIFDAIRSSLKTAQEQARYIGRLLESDKDEVNGFDYLCQHFAFCPELFRLHDTDELPPRTQFSMLNKPAVSIKYGVMKFNMSNQGIANTEQEFQTLVKGLRP